MERTNELKVNEKGFWCINVNIKSLYYFERGINIVGTILLSSICHKDEAAVIIHIIMSEQTIFKNECLKKETFVNKDSIRLWRNSP